MIEAHCAAHGIPFDPTWTAPLERHLTLLERWAPRVNLVGASTLPDAALRHLADSLSLLKLEAVRSVTGHAADLGSGAGFPGLPLAIALPAVQWTLIEPRKKRGAFLTGAIAASGVRNARWLQTRTPDPALDGAFDLVVSRATLEPSALLEHAAPLLAPDGVVVVMAARAPGWSLQGWRIAEEMSFELGGDPRWIASLRRN